MLARCVAFMLLTFALAAHAAQSETPQTIVHVLDYVGVDYGGAVERGRVKDEGEYREMLEFTTQVQEQLKTLPANPKQAELVAAASELARLVSSKADAAVVADAASKLRWAVIGAYDVPVTPTRAPDVQRGARLYAENCAACHGLQGRGDGRAARGLDPPPSNFHDEARMASRSVYGLYNTVTLGVSGTAMVPFRQLSEQDRWALAFFVSAIGTPQARRDQGEKIWAAGEAREVFPDLKNVVTLSRNEVAARYGEKAALAQDHLRAQTAALTPSKAAPLVLARDNLKGAVEAYRRNDVAVAQQLAVSAYLEGFELVEPALDAVDHDLRVVIESDMLRLRTLMRDRVPVSEIEKHVARTMAALDRAEEKLTESTMSPAGAAVSAFVILMREGLEAILVLAAIIAFLVKAERRDALRYIHAGWIGALMLGFVTWWAASYAFAVSGAGREMTEGVTALASTAILLYVGWWLHDKSHARAWKQFIQQRLSGALSGGTIWALASLSFLAVYREVFETVLFYEALWLQAGEAAHGSVVGGMVAAAAALAVVAALVFRYGVRLPIGLFFGVSSAFLAVLAVVFVGQGIGALQEAGAVDATLIDFPRIPWLGVFPTVQSVAAQLAVCAVVIAIVAWGHWAGRRGAS